MTTNRKGSQIEQPIYAVEGEKQKTGEVLSPDAEKTAAQIAMGIEYQESFTLADALKSYNATRVDVPSDRGGVITAEEQQLTIGDAWIKKHAGVFKFRRPGFYDNLKIRVRTEELTNGGTVRLATLWLAEAAALCEVLLTDSPDWFSLDRDMDMNVMWLLHHWYIEWSYRFRNEV